MNQSKIKLLLFDGDCILCNGAIYFLHKRIRYRNYKFVPSKSEQGEIIINKYQLGSLPEESIVLIKNDTIYTKSTAIFQIIEDMPRSWSIFKLFNIFPTKFNDYIYRLISRNRHIFFGRVKRKYE